MVQDHLSKNKHSQIIHGLVGLKVCKHSPSFIESQYILPESTLIRDGIISLASGRCMEGSHNAQKLSHYPSKKDEFLHDKRVENASLGLS